MKTKHLIIIGQILSLCWTLSACQKTATPGNSCTTPLTGTSWTPNIVGSSNSNHNDSSITIYKDTYSASGLLTGLAESFSLAGSHVYTVSGINMNSDLLAQGAIQLNAQVVNFPTSLQGGAYPVLISLSDGTNELVNVSGCDTSGFFSCPSQTCTIQSACRPTTGQPSAFLGSTDTLRQNDWKQHQFAAINASVNTFPSCNWASGTPACDFNSTFFASGKLRSGVNYTAKYVLLTSNYASGIGNSYPATLQLTVIRKKDGNTGTGNNGAIDINVILVGTKNIMDSRTNKGKQNLDALFTHFYNHYYTDNSSSVGVKIGKINVLEWTCENGGDGFASVNINNVGNLFATGSSIVPSSTEGKAVNVFLVSNITSTGAGTILGVSGAIDGASINGTQMSGAAFSTFDQIATFNPNCTNPSVACPITSQQPSFIDMGSTISHEVGHYLGLNHLSESKGTQHDPLPDTPQCTTTDPAASNTLSISSCRSEASCQAACSNLSYATNPYCPTQSVCQFNHVMWWTGKNYNNSGQGDGNIFSTQSGVKINYNPYVQ